jgi:hypothetical protein
MKYAGWMVSCTVASAVMKVHGILTVAAAAVKHKHADVINIDGSKCIQASVCNLKSKITNDTYPSTLTSLQLTSARYYV